MSEQSAGRPERAEPSLPSLPASIARSAALWKRPATATTVLPDQESAILGWQPSRERLAEYRALLGSPAELPIAYPQVPLMAMTMDLVSRWSFPMRAMGMVHMGATVEVLAPLPAEASWDLRCWSTPGRHVRSGLEFDVWGEVSLDGAPAWRSRAVYLSRSRPASGAEESTVPAAAPDGPWARTLALPAAEGTGRAFARVSGDINPIHLHRMPARVLGFPRAIAHGWWIAGRVAALLEADEAIPGRTLEIAFRRPVLLPSTPDLLVRDLAAGHEFRVARAGTDEALCSGRILGG
ncbi:MAG: hypothetical protein MUF35_07300 [Candidatus Nanopelagicales bacterium]|jgi:acyl dehydratase|nr:hypothetical protein [Candidatus Nanopelagicales bacterium]